MLFKRLILTCLDALLACICVHCVCAVPWSPEEDVISLYWN